MRTESNEKTESIKIIHIPDRVKTPHYNSKCRRFRHQLMEENIYFMYYKNDMRTTDRDDAEISVKDEGVGIIPKTLKQALDNNTILVEGVNFSLGEGFYYFSRQLKRNKMSKCEFLYKCIVESQYVEFEEI